MYAVALLCRLDVLIKKQTVYIVICEYLGIMIDSNDSYELPRDQINGQLITALLRGETSGNLLCTYL